MNNLERRQIVKDRLIDVAVAKTSISESRRERVDATKKLRKAMFAGHFASTARSETVSYSRFAG